MPWFQRKARPWDDHWDLYLWSSEENMLDRPWTWTVPDNLYLELLQIRVWAAFTLVGFGVKHSPFIECSRGGIVRWHTTYPDRTDTNQNFFIVWSSIPFHDIGSIMMPRITIALPGTCYLQPGDVLSFDWMNHQAGDYMRRPRITAKSWLIY